jgi:hypothetical protein
MLLTTPAMPSGRLPWTILACLAPRPSSARLNVDPFAIERPYRRLYAGAGPQKPAGRQILVSEVMEGKTS